MLQPSMLVARLLCGVTVCLVTSLIICLSLMVASVQVRQSSSFSLLVAAIALQASMILLPWIALALLTPRWINILARKHKGNAAYSFFITTVLLPSLTLVTVSVVTGIAVATTHVQQSVISQSNSLPAFLPSLAFWILSMVAETGSFACIISLIYSSKRAMPAKSRQSLDAAPSMQQASNPRDLTQEPAFEITRPDRDHGSDVSLLPSSNRVPDLIRSPPLTSPSSEGEDSRRSSFSTLKRPGSAKRNLLKRSISQTQNRCPSVEPSCSSDPPSRRMSHSEGFDTWDTSGVSAHLRETVLLQSRPSSAGSAGSTTKGSAARSSSTPGLNLGMMVSSSALPTIPGSRSPSPAKALEGPFLASDSMGSTPPQSPLPQPSIADTRPTPPSTDNLPLTSAATIGTHTIPPRSSSSSTPTSAQQRKKNTPDFTAMFPKAHTIPATTFESVLPLVDTESAEHSQNDPMGGYFGQIAAPPQACALKSKRSTKIPHIKTVFPSGQQNFSRPSSNSTIKTRSSRNSASFATMRSPRSEEHIHPLFRTTSPIPPPGASSNTKVTAAPEGGLLVNQRAFRRYKTGVRGGPGSLPSSPSALSRSESSPDISLPRRRSSRNTFHIYTSPSFELSERSPAQERKSPNRDRSIKGPVKHDSSNRFGTNGTKSPNRLENLKLGKRSSLRVPLAPRSPNVHTKNREMHTRKRSVSLETAVIRDGENFRYDIP